MSLKHKLPLKVALRKNTNVKSAGYNKYYGSVVEREGLTQRGLIKHITSHIPGISEAMTAAVISQLSQCIPELVAQGVSVKLDGIGIFYPTIANGVGKTDAQMVAGLQPNDFVTGVRFRFRPDSTKLDSLTAKSLRKKTSVELAGIFTTVSSGGENFDVIQPMEEWAKSH